MAAFARVGQQAQPFGQELARGLAVRVEKDGNEAAGGSILGLMMLGAAKGDTVDIIVTGEGCDTALLKLVGLVKDGFGED